MSTTRNAILPGFLAGCLAVMFFAHQMGNASLSATSLAKEEAVGKEPASLSISEEECQVSPVYPEAVRRWCGWITRYAVATSQQPNLIAAIILQESSGNPRAYSHSGAVGLMQVMPRDGIASKFMCINGPCFSNRPSMAELYDPEFNIQYGTQLLADLMQRSGNLREALRAYGPRDVGYAYADKVLRIYASYE